MKTDPTPTAESPETDAPGLDQARPPLLTAQIEYSGLKADRALAIKTIQEAYDLLYAAQRRILASSPDGLYHDAWTNQRLNIMSATCTVRSTADWEHPVVTYVGPSCYDARARRGEDMAAQRLERCPRLPERVLGYRVALAYESDADLLAYRLIGPRTTYTLWRKPEQPEVLFALNAKGHCTSIAGVKWFTDQGGELRAMPATLHNGRTPSRLRDGRGGQGGQGG